MSKSIYVAGKMSGLPGFNFPAFDAAAADLRAKGWRVISPADHDRDTGFDGVGTTGHESLADRGFDLKAALLWDLEQVANVDAIFVLRDWETSKGTAAELALATALGKEIIFQPERPHLIGLGGRLASGKDEVADELVRNHGYVKVGMSDVLHQAMLALDPIVWPTGGISGTVIRPRRYSEEIARVGYVKAKEGHEVRRLLQALGTEVGRKMLGSNIWVTTMKARLQMLRAEGKDIVITGIRYPNEVTMVESIRGKLVWIDRPGYEAAGSHASENSVSAEDFAETLNNDGSLEDLYEKAGGLLK